LTGTAFRHGYIGSVMRRPPPDASWRTVDVGDLRFHLHPALRAATAVDGEVTVLLAGEVVDLQEESTDADRVAGAVARTARHGLDAVLREVAYLGGRWACFVSHGDEFVAIPDCHATQPIFWTGRSGLTVSSHSHLLAEATGAEPDEATIALMARAQEMGTGGTLYYPGARTPFSDVLPVLPNHHLIRRPGSEPSHERFYPFDDTRLEGGYDRFRELFLTHTRLLCGLGRVGISLTAGRDSRTTFLAAVGHLPSDSFTFTFHDFGRNAADALDDLIGANALSFEFGVPHRILPLDPFDRGTDFADAYDRTFRRTRQFARAAQAFHRCLPGDFHHLMSMVAESGTGFYKSRKQPHIDPERLSSLYSRFEFGSLPEVVEAHREFIGYADFHQSRLGPIDYHDAFYWEARVGRWSILRMQEGDLSHRVLLPFNQRGIIEALQSLPLEERLPKQPLARLGEELAATLRRGELPPCRPEWPVG
jgi:hypothetical protein